MFKDDVNIAKMAFKEAISALSEIDQAKLILAVEDICSPIIKRSKMSDPRMKVTALALAVGIMSRAAEIIEELSGDESV